MLSINIADVIAVINTMIPQLVIIGVVLVAAIICTIAAIKIKKPLKGFVRKQAWLVFLLALVLVVTNILLGPVYSMVNMAMGGGKISDESSEQAKVLCTQIAEEGIVLLKNDSPVPVFENNIFDFVVTVADGAHVDSVFIDGVEAVRGGEYLLLDEEEVRAKCQEQAVDFWKRNDWPTP